MVLISVYRPNLIASMPIFFTTYNPQHKFSFDIQNLNMSWFDDIEVLVSALHVKKTAVLARVEALLGRS